MAFGKELRSSLTGSDFILLNGREWENGGGEGIEVPVMEKVCALLENHLRPGLSPSHSVSKLIFLLSSTFLHPKTTSHPIFLQFILILIPGTIILSRERKKR